MKKFTIYLIAAAILAAGCQKDDDGSEGQPEGQLAGGETTIFSAGPDAYTFPLANLEADGLQRHLEADGAFGQQFVTAPAPQFGGVGPLFNQNSCESCHIRNGRSAVPQYLGDATSGLLLRLSAPGQSPNGGNLPLPGFGLQLQTKAIFGVQPEGQVGLDYVEEVVAFLDGTEASLQRPHFTVENPYLPLPAGFQFSPRNAPPVFGLGLLEAVPAEQVLAHADPDDSDGDGISGRPNWAWDVVKQEKSLGRFGWKAGNPTSVQQTADAFNHDMGVTNPYFPAEECAGQGNCSTGLSDDLDIEQDFLDLTSFYFQTLAVPAARLAGNDAAKAGKKLFEKAKCSSCHLPTFTTGPHVIGELSNQTIFPYTDLLLHDLGEDLADHRPEFEATGTEWRTPPLWGIGLTQAVNPKAGFLHDGRARTLEEAILWHGGEAAASRDFFLKSSEEERQQLVAFLKAL